MLVAFAIALYLYARMVHERLKADHFEQLWNSPNSNLKKRYHRVCFELSQMIKERNHWRDLWKGKVRDE